jgi:hypothetical protein
MTSTGRGGHRKSERFQGGSTSVGFAKRGSGIRDTTKPDDRYWPAPEEIPTVDELALRMSHSKSPSKRYVDLAESVHEWLRLNHPAADQATDTTQTTKENS